MWLSTDGGAVKPHTTAPGRRSLPDPTAFWDSRMRTPVRRTVTALVLTAALLAVLALAVSSLFTPMPVSPR